MGTVLNIVVNSFINDSRVLRTATLGTNLGYKVVVLAQHKAGLATKECIDDIRVIRIKLVTGNLPKTAPFQGLKYVEFIIRAFFIAVKIKPELIHAHDLTALPIAAVVKPFTKSKIIYDSHEFFMYRNGKFPFLKVGLKFERFFARKCDTVITVSDSIAKGLKETLGLEHKPTVILNVPFKKELDRSKAVLRHKLKIPADDFVFLYQGGLQKDRGVELLLEAVRGLDRPNTKLVIIGNGVLKEKLKLMAEDLVQRGKVIFHDSVPQNELHLWTMGADVGIHPMVGSCFNHLYALPNKLFEYIQSGLCVIVSDLPEMSALVNKFRIGITFKDNDSESLRSAMKDIVDNGELKTTLTENTRIVANKYNWEVEVQKLKQVYERLLHA